jgi:hypothetical protein
MPVSVDNIFGARSEDWTQGDDSRERMALISHPLPVGVFTSILPRARASQRVASIRLATGHCFDATYSARFRPTAGDYTICPCEHIPRRTRRRHIPHTKEHVLFRCMKTVNERRTFLRGSRSLAHILQSKERTAALCRFLTVTNSSLLRPLPKPTPTFRDPPSSEGSQR